tara:strand:+ start:93 stop:878 length:786 start_codon:yes stop_codon:yes gene_type:complete
MSFITLTSDLGVTDHYVASVKGSIYSEVPQAVIVDVTHHIEKYNMAQAAFIVKNAFASFPVGTIHLIGVRPFASDWVDHIVALYKGHYFIGADNGMFSLIFDQAPEKVFSLRIATEEGSTFPLRDVFAKAACHIARGGTLEVMGSPKQDVNRVMSFEPIVHETGIKGVIQHVDTYGNLITNIQQEIFKQVSRNRPLRINFRSPGFSLQEISNNYDDVPEGELVGFFGNTGYLEVAINSGSASQLLGLRVNDSVMIDFFQTT